MTTQIIFHIDNRLIRHVVNAVNVRFVDFQSGLPARQRPTFTTTPCDEGRTTLLANFRTKPSNNTILIIRTFVSGVMNGLLQAERIAS